MLLSQGMAHSPNIAIPAQLSFRPFRALWVTCQAEILGWLERPELSGRNRYPLFASIAKDRRTGPTEIEKVIARVDVPSDEDLQGVRGMLHPWSSYSIEIYRSDIPSKILLPHENRRTCLDISGRQFDVLACPMRNFEELFPPSTSDGIEEDAWEMREEFLSIPEDSGELSGFLNRWGLWNASRGYDARNAFSAPPLGFALAFPHLIWQQRRNFSKGLVGRPSAWLRSATPLKFSQSSEPPYFTETRSFCEAAIEATISIDHLRNLKFRLCRLKDCNRPYLVKTKQKRMYCCPEHAHLANVRKQRAEKRKAEAERRKQNAKG